MMRSLLVALPGLGRAAMMAGMMWVMSRRGRPDGGASSGPPPADRQAQINDLQAEVDRLRADLDAEQRQSDTTS